MADTHESVEQKRNYYLQIMQKAQQLNDHVLIQLILKKLALLGAKSRDTATGNCIIIPFPTVPFQNELKEYERPTWWTIIYLTLAIPGSLVALILLAYFRMGPGVY